ncbi:hypothetical protein LguiA_010822 [Lonicera macranthoides]
MKSKNKRKSVKVVYISSPMKVKTSASRFRSLVQQLTGRNSDVSGGATDTYSGEAVSDDHKRSESNSVSDMFESDAHKLAQHELSNDQQSSSVLLEDCVFKSDMVEQLEEMFPSSLFQVSRPIPSVYSQFDVVASFS